MDLDYRPFNIVVEGGNVSLSGYLTSEEEKKSAIRIVRSVKGVTNVEEDLKVVNYDAYRDKS